MFLTILINVASFLSIVEAVGVYPSESRSLQTQYLHTSLTLTFKLVLKVLTIYQNVLFPSGQDEISLSPVVHVESEN